MREVCAKTLINQNKKIGVEIHESVFVRRKYYGGRILNQQWVFGGICQETRECFLRTVENRRAIYCLLL